MSKEDGAAEPGYLSPQDMRSWMRQEIRDAAKAYELRVRDLTEFVTAYALGEITAQQADERNWQYHVRWGEALPGICATDSVTDEQILAAVDETRRSSYLLDLGHPKPSGNGRKPGASR
jgi:hypothetical protein